MYLNTPVRQDMVVIREKHYQSGRGVPYPTGLAIDLNSKQIYISDWKANCIDVFSKSLAWEKIFTKFRIKSPRGLRFKHNMLYVAESDGNIQHSCIKVFYKNGVLAQEIGCWGERRLRFQYSLSLDVDTSGNIYICDALNAAIKISSDEGNFVAQFGFKYLQWPIDIRIYNTLIYVLDYHTKCMSVFTLLDYYLVTKFKLPRQCAQPNYFVINQENELIIVDKLDHIYKMNEFHIFMLVGKEKTINRKGIEINGEGNLVHILSNQEKGHLQIIEDPCVVSF